MCRRRARRCWLISWYDGKKSLNGLADHPIRLVRADVIVIEIGIPDEMEFRKRPGEPPAEAARIPSPLEEGVRERDHLDRMARVGVLPHVAAVDVPVLGIVVFDASDAR